VYHKNVPLYFGPRVREVTDQNKVALLWFTVYI